MIDFTINEINYQKECNLAENEYRKKICSKCNDEQKKKRRCTLLQHSSKSSCLCMKWAVDNRKKVKELHDLVIKEMTDDLSIAIGMKEETKIRNDLIN